MTGANAVARGPSDGPSSPEIVLMLAVAVAVHLLIWSLTWNYWTEAPTWRDNPDYLRIAAAVQYGAWTCEPACPANFWGFPYAIVAVARVFRISHIAALVAISLAASFATCVLIQRLYGGWVAAAVLAAVAFSWIPIAAHGGSEPLFMCLLLGALTGAGRGHVRVAASLAVLSAMVRPLGVFAVAALGLDALLRRDKKDLLAIGAITVFLSVAYLAPIVAIAHDPLISIKGYRSNWSSPNAPLTIPLASLALGGARLLRESPKAALIACAWVVVSVASLWTSWSTPSAERERTARLFLTGYILFMFCYNDPDTVYFLSRYMLPIAPIMIGVLQQWIPRSRWVLWSLLLASSVVSVGGLARFGPLFG
jgi:hypothetical protein